MLYIALVLGSVCDPETSQSYLYTLFNSVCLETGHVGQPVGGLGHVLSGWVPCSVKAAADIPISVAATYTVPWVASVVPHWLCSPDHL